VKLSGDDLSRYCNKIEAVGLRKSWKCLYGTIAILLPTNWRHSNKRLWELATHIMAGKQLS